MMIGLLLQWLSAQVSFFLTRYASDRIDLHLLE
jgi:hypothetical protein